MTIGQLAKQSGVGIETIRFYERRSLIPEPPRTASGYRQYDQAAVRRVLFIRRAQELRNLSTTMGHSTGLIREQCPVW